MKKNVFILIITITITIFTLTKNTTMVKAIDNNAKASILIESTTQKILIEKNMHDKLAPASMTKMMTLYLVFESIKSNTLDLSDIIKVSKEAELLGGSQIYLKENESITILELIKSVAISSANDSATQLAIEVSSTVDNFVKKMNDTLIDFGLKNTNFKNPTGLDEEGHYSTAYDMSIIASKLINTYPEVLDYTKLYEGYVRENTDNKFWLINTNKLVKYHNNIDGLKTGYTNNSKFCLTSTMFDKDIRVISVVMGAETKEERDRISLNQLNYGVSNFKVVNILPKYQKLINFNSIKYLDKEYNFMSNEQVNFVVEKNENKSNVHFKYNKDINIYLDNKEDYIDIYINNTKYRSVEIIPDNKLRKVNFIKFFLRFYYLIINS